MAQLKGLIQAGWGYLREFSGENDYARYKAQSLARRQIPVTPQVFYVQRLKEKYSRISRCC